LCFICPPAKSAVSFLLMLTFYSSDLMAIKEMYNYFIIQLWERLRFLKNYFLLRDRTISSLTKTHSPLHHNPVMTYSRNCRSLLVTKTSPILTTEQPTDRSMKKTGPTMGYSFRQFQNPRNRRQTLKFGALRTVRATRLLPVDVVARTPPPMSNHVTRRFTPRPARF